MRRLLTLLLVAMLVVAPASVAFAADDIQQTNSSDSSSSESGSAGGGSDASFSGGPEATASGGTGGAQQTGSNTGNLEQSGSARTGDSAAGAQIAAGTGQSATVQQQNTSIDATALAGNATLANSAELFIGPFALADGEDGVPSAQQIGDNSAILEQTGTASSGDAVAGSQVTGLVESESATIQNQNSSTGATANLIGENGSSESFGNASVSNDGNAITGPQAINGGVVFDVTQINECFLAFACINETTITAEAEVGDAHASQVGDNLAAVSQASDATTGDAMAGSQVAGAIAPEVTIQEQNDSLDSAAFSGTADATNDANAESGPQAGVSLGEVDLLQVNSCALVGFCVNEADIDVTITGEGLAQSTQTGDNRAELSQASSAATGDALAGAQTAGAVSADAAIQLQNVSAGDVAVSGAAVALDGGNAIAGPQSGVLPLEVNVVQINECFLAGGCDNEAAVSVDATGVTVDTQASQIGDNAIAAFQDERAATGDAVAGAQVAGLIGAGDVQVTGDADGAAAISGSAVATGSLGGALGPQALSEASAQTFISQSNDCDIVVDGCDNTAITATATGPSGLGAATQSGSNTLDTVQNVATSTGDAVAGGQVTGVVDA